jgi:hypothetical protein
LAVYSVFRETVQKYLVAGRVPFPEMLVGRKGEMARKGRQKRVMAWFIDGPARRVEDRD